MTANALMDNEAIDDEYTLKVHTISEAILQLERNKVMLYRRGRKSYYNQEEADEEADRLMGKLSDLTVKYGYNSETDELKDRVYKLWMKRQWK